MLRHAEVIVRTPDRDVAFPVMFMAGSVRKTAPSAFNFRKDPVIALFLQGINVALKNVVKIHACIDPILVKVEL